VGMLAIGLICNLLVRPLPARWFMSDEELEHEKRLAHEKAIMAESTVRPVGAAQEATPAAKVFLAWLVVGIPLAWGVYRTLLAAAKFFH
jgi:hypothetical protein